MNPGIDIGERIRLVFKKTGWSVAYFAQQIQKDRTIAYNIFKENNKLIRMEKEKNLLLIR